MVTRLMESLPSSRLSFFDQSGAIIPCPVDGRKCGIAIDVARDLGPTMSLKLGTVLLPVRQDAAMCPHSEWPACGPGYYHLSLECGDISEHRAILVLPRHFSAIEVNSITDELIELPKSIALQLQNCGGLLGTNLALNHELSIDQEFFKLRRAVTGTKERLGMLQILPIIQRDCYQVLVPRNEIRDADKVRRPDILKLHQAVSMPGNVLAIQTLKRMFDVTFARSFDTYENRLVKAYVQALQSQMWRLHARLESEPAPPAIATDLEALISEFRLACTRATFLKKVRLPFISAEHVTMVLLKNPAYRAVLEGYLALYKQSSVRLEEPALKTPLNKFPVLYQLWANLKVVSVALQVCTELGYRCVSHAWVKTDNKGIFIGAMNYGEAAIQLSCPTTGRVVALAPWKENSGSDNILTTNQEVPPPLSIVILTPEEPPVVLLFDPKYNAESDNQAVAKTSAETNKMVETCSAIEPMKEDVDQLLQRMEQMTADGVREIRYAAILYPGQRKQIAPDLEALPARPSDGEALQKNVFDVLRRYLA